MEPLLDIRGITKTYPGVTANDAVSLSVDRGEIRALLGQNGAGKSTLVKIIYGAARPESGTMRFDAAPFAPARPSEARARGIGMVFQHFSLFDALTVAENVALGLAKAAVNDDLERRIVDVSQAYGLPLDPGRRIGMLSVGERQRVEIVRCLLQRPRLLIMDEPTSVLTPQEADALFRTLRKVAREGCAILYISHKLKEIIELCETATIMRGGKAVATCDPRRETAESLAETMIGSTLRAPKPAGRTPGPVRLTVRRLSLEAATPFGVALDEVSFELRAGEILGIAGVAGNGQTELMEALVGERFGAHEDAIVLDGRTVAALGPTERRARGMCFVAEERLGHGAVPEASLVENALVSARDRMGLVSRGVVRLDRAAAFAEKLVTTFKVQTAGIAHAAGSLSGGNLQKFIVGREILQEPAVLIAAQPTWGLDAGAAADIHEALAELARRGAAVLVVSQDLDELTAISTRLAVISEGRLSEPRPVGNVSVEEIGLLMGGIHGRADGPGRAGAGAAA